MTTETILWIVLYIILCIWVMYKESETDNCNPSIFVFIVAPVWFLFALIKQFIIRKWD